MVQHLSGAQNGFISSIENYGMSHGFDETAIRVARDIAFNESSLGANSNASKVGPYQYAQSTWDSTRSSNIKFSGLNINSIADQINAIFQEIKYYGDQSTAAVRAGNTLYSNYSAGDYIDAAHHFHCCLDNPHVTKDDLDNGKTRRNNAIKALGEFNIVGAVDPDGQRRGTYTAASTEALRLAWLNFDPSFPRPQVIIGPAQVPDSFGVNWNMP